MKLYGAILGDLAGQPYEFNYKGDYSEFDIHDKKSHFTDDTIMTLATAKLMIDLPKEKWISENFEEYYKEFGNKYDGDFYGSKFKKWLKSPKGTINDSFGNGCIMRLSPLIYIPNSYYGSIKLFIESSTNSHFHPKVIRNLFRYNYYYNNLHKYIDINIDNIFNFKFKKFTSDVDDTMDFVAKVINYSKTTHSAIETSIKSGGDTDTHASILGELYNYTLCDINEKDIKYVDSKLDNYLLSILKEFNEKF